MTVNQLLKRLAAKTLTGEVKWAPYGNGYGRSICQIGSYAVRFEYRDGDMMLSRTAELAITLAGSSTDYAIFRKWWAGESGIGLAGQLHHAIEEAASYQKLPSEERALSELEAALDGEAGQ